MASRHVWLSTSIPGCVLGVEVELNTQLFQASLKTDLLTTFKEGMRLYQQGMFPFSSRGRWRSLLGAQLQGGEGAGEGGGPSRVDVQAPTNQGNAAGLCCLVTNLNLYMPIFPECPLL